MHIKAEIADTREKHLRGLSGSSEKRSMVFIMPYPNRWPITMKNMRFPVTILFLDYNMHIFEMRKAVPQTLDPRTWKTYRPSFPCKYIIETPFDLNVSIGDLITWEASVQNPCAS